MDVVVVAEVDSKGGGGSWKKLRTVTEIMVVNVVKAHRIYVGILVLAKDSLS